MAYVVAGILGLDTSAYSIGYVAGWSNGEPGAIKATAANVLRAAHTLAGRDHRARRGERRGLAE